MNINFPHLTDLEGRLEAKRSELAAIFAQARPGGDGTIDLSKVADRGTPAEVAAAIKTLNDEMTDLGAQIDADRAVLAAAEAVQRDPDDPAGEPSTQRRSRPASIGERFVGSQAFKARSGHVESDIDLSLADVMRPKATLFETGAGWAPESTRSGLVVLDAQRPVQVTDLLPQIPTTQSAYKYMEETTFTNNAAEKAEGAAFGEAALVLTERSVTIEKVTVWLPVTDEQLEDEPGAMAYIDARLPFMIRQRVDSQILVGDGVTPNIRGANQVSGIQTQAKGTDPVPDAVYKAMTKVRVVGRAQPSAVVFHPNDWQDVRLLRTADGIYIWGSPSDAGPLRIWGVLVVESDAQTENTALVADFANHSLLVVRRGITMKVSDSHSTFFVEGKQAVRADMRLATVWTRPEAIATVTGI